MQPSYYITALYNTVGKHNPFDRTQTFLDNGAATDTLVQDLVQSPSPDVAALHGLVPMVLDQRLNVDKDGKEWSDLNIPELKFKQDDFLEFIKGAMRVSKVNFYYVDAEKKEVGAQFSLSVELCYIADVKMCLVFFFYCVSTVDMVTHS